MSEHNEHSGASGTSDDAHVESLLLELTDEDRQNGAGTGLGLPLTKALVEANRAYFDLESTPGEGTIAHIQFPSQRVLAD